MIYWRQFHLMGGLASPQTHQAWFVKISLRRRHAQTVKNGASSNKTNYIDIFSEILNPEGHQNCCIGSKVTAILLNR